MRKFNRQLFGQRVREKRGTRSLREVSDELQNQISPSTLSRIENGKLPDVHNLVAIWDWLGDDFSLFILSDDKDDPIVGQLRAAQNMSAETASAFMEIIRAAYAEILEAADDEDKA
jgi:hypothetical protein